MSKASITLKKGRLSMVWDGMSGLRSPTHRSSIDPLTSLQMEHRSMSLHSFSVLALGEQRFVDDLIGRSVLVDVRLPGNGENGEHLIYEGYAKESGPTNFNGRSTVALTIENITVVTEDLL